MLRPSFSPFCLTPCFLPQFMKKKKDLHINRISFFFLLFYPSFPPFSSPVTGKGTTNSLPLYYVRLPAFSFLIFLVGLLVRKQRTPSVFKRGKSTYENPLHFIPFFLSFCFTFCLHCFTHTYGHLRSCSHVTVDL